MTLFHVPQSAPLILRPYQREAVEAVYAHLRDREDNPGVEIPTAGGKSAVISQIIMDTVNAWGGRCIALTHVKELVQQTHDELSGMSSGLDIGIYSAGLNQRDTRNKAIIAGIQSVYQKAHELGRADLLLIDEAHLIPPDGEGMYQQFFTEAKIINPKIRICGFTATPFRMKSGSIATKDGIINSICYRIGVRDLIEQGYLSPLVSKVGSKIADTDQINLVAGEFNSQELNAVFNTNELVESAVSEIIEYTRNRKSVLIFCAGVQHGQHVVEEFARKNIPCEWVDGTTSPERRAEVARAFKAGEIKYLANMNIYTTGFNARCVDCVCLVRSTMSAGLYYQMVGRGFRLCEGKTDCLILDYGGNIVRHGPVDTIKAKEKKKGEKGVAGEPVVKACPNCHSICGATALTCPDCGHIFPERKPTHDGKAYEGEVLSGEMKIETYEVAGVSYAVHHKRNAPDAPPTLRVDYRISAILSFSEWICIQHAEGSFARSRAKDWWATRSLESFPKTVEAAMNLANAGCLATPKRITVKIAPNEFDRIMRAEIGAMPPRLDGCTDAYAAELESDPALRDRLEAQMSKMADEIPF